MTVATPEHAVADDGLSILPLFLKEEQAGAKVEIIHASDQRNSAAAMLVLSGNAEFFTVRHSTVIDLQM